jgi:TetR/AcrR family transcriptional regulator, transcriptional repressor for nem operon
MNDSKEHIIVIASKLFLQKSYKEVTMKEIVKETGLSKGAFYHYFESKEQLFKEVLTYFFTCIKHDYNKYSNKSLYQFYHDYIEGTINLSKEYIEKFRAKSEDGNYVINYFVMIFDALKLYPEFRDLVIIGFDAEIEIWAKRVEQARAAGEIHSSMNDHEIAKTFMYLSDGVAMHMLMRGVSLEEMIEPYVVLWDKFYEQIKA